MKRRRGSRPRPERAAQAAPGTPWLALHGSPDPSPRESRLLTRAAWTLAALLAVGLAAMIFGPHRVGDYMTETDFFGAYAEGARLIQQGQLDPSRYGVIGPVYEVVLAVWGFVIPDLFLAAELLSLVCSTAALLLWFHILRGRSNARVALLACAFVVSNGVFIRYGYSATTDALALALQSLALWLVLERPGVRSVVVAGVVGAVAFLTRYNAVYLLPAGVLILALGGGAQALARADRLKRAGVFAAAFVAPVLPWVLYSLARGGTLSFQLHHNIAYEVFARPQGITWDDYQKILQPEFASLWDVIGRDPAAVALRIPINFFDHMRLDAEVLLGWPVAIACIVGLGFVVVSGAWRKLWPIGLAGGLLFLTLVPVFHSARYSLSLLPVYATLAGACFGLPLYALALGRGPRVWLKPVLALVPLVFAASSGAAFIRQSIVSLPVEVLEIAPTLRSLKSEGDKVIARKGHMAYYAGLESAPFPFVNDLDSLAAYARQEDARWLYVSWVEVWTRPRFWFLLDTTAVVPGLTLRAFTRNHPAALYEIGPEFGTQPAWYTNDTLRSLHTARAQLIVDPMDATALYALAHAENSLGNLAAARTALAKLLTVDPENFSGLLILGDTALRQRDLEVAHAAFEKAGVLRPESVAARVGLGWVLVEAGRGSEAAAYWRPVIAQTTDPATLVRMLELFRSLGDQEAVAATTATLRRVRGG